MTACLPFDLKFSGLGIKDDMHFSFSCSTRPVVKEREEESVNLEKTTQKYEPIDVELEEIALMRTGDVPNENQADNCKNNNP